MIPVHQKTIDRLGKASALHPSATAQDGNDDDPRLLSCFPLSTAKAVAGSVWLGRLRISQPRGGTEITPSLHKITKRYTALPTRARRGRKDMARHNVARRPSRQSESQPVASLIAIEQINTKNELCNTSDGADLSHEISTLLSCCRAKRA